MTHIGKKLRLHSIGRFCLFLGGLELNGALSDALFEASVQAANLFFGSFALGNIGTNGYVLARFTIFVKEGDDRRVDPIIGAIFRAVLDLAVPDLAVCDGPPELADEFFRVI